MRTIPPRIVPIFDVSTLEPTRPNSASHGPGLTEARRGVVSGGMRARGSETRADAAEPLLNGPVGSWFQANFPEGPTSGQSLAWPIIALRKHLLLVSPTGTGKTFAAFLAILDRLFREQAAGVLEEGVRCVYVSPLRSLGYDIERNLSDPLNAIQGDLTASARLIRVAVRTGDTSAYQRKKQLEKPPHLLITTPESLSLLLSQEAWHGHWAGVSHVIVDEVHSLVPTKRGADLAVSLERLSALTQVDPCRIGLSATCDPTEPVARYLVGPSRECQVIKAPESSDSRGLALDVESLITEEEASRRTVTYRRLLRRLREQIVENRTTVVFANTRAFTEKLTHDLRRTLPAPMPEAIAAHHSALDAERRREVESALKSGALRAVVTSTSLELGVDIGTADLTVQVGLPGGVSRCLQRVGRSGHRVGAISRGVILAATPAELAGAVVTANESRQGRVEPLCMIDAPLDVLCQQLIGMACGGEWSVEEAFALIRRAGPMVRLTRSDFDHCLDFLAGELAAPAGAAEVESAPSLRWTAPRIWRRAGLFGLRSRRVARWFRSNVGTITSEESVRVQLLDGHEIGTLEGAYAERLKAGDSFVLDGRCLEFRRLDGLTLIAKPTQSEPNLPRWSSDRQALSPQLSDALALFREQASLRLAEGPSSLRGWLAEEHGLDPDAAGVLVALFEAQEQLSEIPGRNQLLIEESPREDGTWSYVFHAPLNRAACEALGRATAARLGRHLGQDLSLVSADLGWAIRLPEGVRLGANDFTQLDLFRLSSFDEDVMEGLDRGELPARRFRHIAATALMVLSNPEGGKRRVGGLLWVSRRLYPLVKTLSPDHPLLRETRREILQDLLDVPSALAWLKRGPEIRLRVLSGLSPFASAWIDPSEPEPLRFDSPADALKRLHARLSAGAGHGGEAHVH